MYRFKCECEVASASKDRFVSVSAWVSDDPPFARFPASLLRSFGYEPSTVVNWIYAETGKSLEMPAGDVWLRLGGELHAVLALFEDEECEPSLGINSLGVYRLEPDVSSGTLARFRPRLGEIKMPIEVREGHNDDR